MRAGNSNSLTPKSTAPVSHPTPLFRASYGREAAVLLLEAGLGLKNTGSRIIPEHSPRLPGDAESLDVWGFRDSGFRVLPNGSVTLTGSRYALSGAELPDLLPWMRKIFGVDLPIHETHDSAYPPEIPPPRENPGFLREVGVLLPEHAVSTDPEIRLRHGHGHTLEEMYAIKYGRLVRVPDLVVLPETEEQVGALVAAAVRHDVCLVPYGGGTNVTDALRCPPDEDRPIVSVDLSRLDKILWIDPVNLMACIQAGAVGRRIQVQLAKHGFTMGHEPDSVEFSTLGGWIATFASGMKKNRYGNIEDVVLDVHAVTPRGVIARDAVAPRESVGVDPRRWLFGSEGTLGIITRAVVKIFPLPEVQRYDALLFPTFEEGVGFLFDLTREAVPPASVRLVDNVQFQLSQTLKPKPSPLQTLKRRVERLVVTGLKGFDPTQMVACTLVYEGSRREVRAQEESVRQLARRHGGMRAGAENGKRGYQLTFGIAYIRDFAMRHYVLGESFETSVPWSGVLELCDNVKRRLIDECSGRGVPGKPFVTARVTQVYQTGVCVYFYFAFYHKEMPHPMETYAELERCARDEILLSGGSLSHHHGVGKLRRGFLPRILTPVALEWAAEVKRAVDPANVFGIANQLVGAEPPGVCRTEPTR
jgi:alkyldihydroxyacetonephosphate synthase